MKIRFLIFLPALFLSSPIFSQCNFKGINKRLLRNTISESIPDIQQATRTQTLFDKLDFGGGYSFLKGSDGTFFHLYLNRRNSKRFAFNPNTPLLLTTSSGKEIALSPNGEYTGKFKLNIFWIGCFYTIAEEDIETLSKEEVASITIHINSEKKIKGGLNWDASGWHYDEVTGKNFYKGSFGKNKKRNLKQMAACMLINIK